MKGKNERFSYALLLTSFQRGAPTLAKAESLCASLHPPRHYRKSLLYSNARSIAADIDLAEAC